MVEEEREKVKQRERRRKKKWRERMFFFFISDSTSGTGSLSLSHFWFSLSRSFKFLGFENVVRSDERERGKKQRRFGKWVLRDFGSEREGGGERMRVFYLGILGECEC
jgi:hypothetical protein